jgi:hypothetical protein
LRSEINRTFSTVADHLSVRIHSFTIYCRSRNPRPSKIAGIAFSIRTVRVSASNARLNRGSLRNFSFNSSGTGNSGGSEAYHWIIKTPARNYYGDGDEAISTGLGQLAMTYQRAIGHGNPRVEAISTGPTTHRGTFARAVPEWKTWFDAP